MTTDIRFERRSALAEDRKARLSRMLEIRAFEDKAKELFGAGLVHGTTHTAHGQEAVAVAVGASTRLGDWVTCTYRGHGIALALGLTPESVLGEIMGRTCGSIGGVGGSMHLSDTELGLLPTFAIVGAGIPVAVGAALTCQVKETGGVGVAVFGDGATNIGAFHEGLNLAAIWRLPAVFVCENNVYGEYSRIDKTTPIADLVDRADSYGMRKRTVDGQDSDVACASLREEVDRTRAGEGPVLVEMKTYRYAGHSRADQAPYRPAGEFDDWYKRDPINTFERRLIDEGVLTLDSAAALRRDAAQTVETALEYVSSFDEPGTEAMFRNILA